MGNEQSNSDTVDTAEKKTSTPSDRVNLRRQESTHLAQESSDDKSTTSPSLPPPKSSSPSVTPTTSTTLTTITAPTLKTKTKQNFSLHNADSKDGDRRKFYHPAVDTELVGEVSKGKQSPTFYFNSILFHCTRTHPTPFTLHPQTPTPVDNRKINLQLSSNG